MGFSSPVSSKTRDVPSKLVPARVGSKRRRKRSVPELRATGCTGKLPWCKLSMNVSTSSEVASFLCATGCTSRWPISGTPSLPLLQTVRLPAFLAIVRASLVSYTYGIHCRLAFPEDLFGPSSQERRLIAERLADCRRPAADPSVTPV